MEGWLCHPAQAKQGEDGSVSRNPVETRVPREPSRERASDSVRTAHGGHSPFFLRGSTSGSPGVSTSCRRERKSLRLTAFQKLMRIRGLTALDGDPAYNSVGSKP